MNRQEFVTGLAVLSLATVGKTPDDAVAEVYFDSLGNRATGQEWLTFCRGAKERYRYWPSLAEVLEALREFQGQSVDVEAGAAYEAVLNAGTWAPEGTYWDAKVIAGKCGSAAAIAFQAAGGHDAFVTTFAAERRREKFSAAYKVAVAGNHQSALPAAVQKQLPAPEPMKISHEEACDVLAKIAGLNAGEDEAQEEESA